ncbi:MAG: response regulator [Pseudodesulfovibrio sp.]|jgi:DNA-binding NtrC family response regulator|uniref:Response regulator n=1 Tax=Pseudodesulfovibrio indicus TaxID=1716143 RepID=A0A126QNE1_9BACT|nr:response regulator [Pseudodesulfovibrio indicus]AMK10945.1 response regulator [Pseudodesulfovibrio indicus]TDT91940.1 response regulator receiver domain-containing protein [Pseudodesulfovibrio indicus]
MKKIRLLLVDDEADFRTAYARRFVRRNAEITQAASGQEAIDKIRENDFDVVILDVMMPEMNGIETLRRIKAIDPTLPVIILTGHADSKVLIQGMDMGAFDFLLKPVGTDELYFKVLDAVRSRHRVQP